MCVNVCLLSIFWHKANVGKWAKAGFGLGRNLQERRRAISVTPKHNHCGLGYKSSSHERRWQMEKWRENRLANLKGQKNDDEPITFPPLYQTFRLGGCINLSLSVEYKDVVATFFTLTINATKEDKEIAEDICSIVHPCSPDFELNNWNAIEIPINYKSTE